jgi:hypothetical protein
MGKKATDEKVATIATTLTRVGVRDALNWQFCDWSRVLFSSKSFGNQRFGLHC